MDPALIAPVLTGPKSSDNATVILWVVVVLVIALALLVRVVYRWVEQGRADCRAETAKAWEEVAKRDATILDLTRQAIQAQHANATATEHLGNAISELTSAVRGSGPQKAMR